MSSATMTTPGFSSTSAYRLIQSVFMDNISSTNGFAPSTQPAGASTSSWQPSVNSTAMDTATSMMTASTTTPTTATTMLTTTSTALSTEAIVGIVVGCAAYVVVMILIVYLICCCTRRRKKRQLPVFPDTNPYGQYGIYDGHGWDDNSRTRITRHRQTDDYPPAQQQQDHAEFSNPKRSHQPSSPGVHELGHENIFISTNRSNVTARDMSKPPGPPPLRRDDTFSY